MIPKSYYLRNINFDITVLLEKENRETFLNEDKIKLLLFESFKSKSYSESYAKKLAYYDTKPELDNYFDQIYKEIKILIEIENGIYQNFGKDFYTMLGAMSITLIDNIIYEWAKLLKISIKTEKNNGYRDHKNEYTLLWDIREKLKELNKYNDDFKIVIEQYILPLYDKEKLNFRNELIHRGFEKNFDETYLNQLSFYLINLINAYSKTKKLIEEHP
ncbi:MAG: hypothetical protein RXO36_07115, partial [Candidatus Nanopusillus acidilobi]